MEESSNKVKLIKMRNNKILKIEVLFILILSIFFTDLSAQNKSKRKTRRDSLKVLQEREFNSVDSLLRSNNFQVNITRVFSNLNIDPKFGQLISNLHLDDNSLNADGRFVITDSVIKGYMPFFGRVYKANLSESGGIEFDNKIKERKISIRKKRKYKIIIYKFVIPSSEGNDIYDITIEASSINTCYIHVNSNNKESIMYMGNIQKKEENID